MEQPEGFDSELKKKYAERMAAREREMQLRALLQNILEPAAYERLSNIRLSNPGLYEKIASVLLSLAQSGQLGGKVSEEKLKSLVARLTARPETKISFARK